MLRRSWFTSNFLHDRRSSHDWDKIGYERYLEQAGVYNLEELDPDPFMEALNEYGLPWVVVENPQMVD